MGSSVSFNFDSQSYNIANLLLPSKKAVAENTFKLWAFPVAIRQTVDTTFLVKNVVSATEIHD
jgi:hypothetical protein